MGKQLSLYLDEHETKRLAELAANECRRPHDQARYLLRWALGLCDDVSTQPMHSYDASRPQTEGVALNS